MSDQHVIQQYFAAMRRGAEAEEQLLALFHTDAVYAEPFTSSEPAVGIAQIRARLRMGWESPLPDMELDVLAVEIDGPIATSRWECRSSGLSGPVQGEDRYEIRGGKIIRLEVRILD